MKIQILDKTKKKKFIEGISYLGVEKIPLLLMATGTERVRAFSGSLSNEEIMAFWRLFPIEGVGLYFGKDFVDKRNGKREVRLSLDALHILKEQIKSGVVVLDKEQENEWFLGKDVDGGFDEKGFVAVSDGKDFIGTGKVTEDGKRLMNFLPKERRRRES